MESNLREQLRARLAEYSMRRANKKEEELVSGDATKIPYGTAGFRGNAGQIEHLFFNVGLISGLRCLKLRANIGVMITASHNPIQDNGVKLIDGDGEMLHPDWELLVEKFCNLQEETAIIEELDSIITSCGIDLMEKSADDKNNDLQVLIGMDTRPSSEALVALVKQGLEAWSPMVKYLDYGLLTTPALHFLVAESNRRQINELPLRTYYDQLISGTVAIFSDYAPLSELHHYSPDRLVIDCANGVGSETMQYLCKSEEFFQCLPVKLINTGDGILNRLCGADYVKTMQLPPSGADEVGKRYAALDGDADRVVYFYLEQVMDEGKLQLKLLDGDKIMALYALYLVEALKEANLDGELSMGIVQTAYANGASTDYMSQVLGLKVDCVDTGVKNLHKQALNYDIGIYFEANGHGTIWISQKARCAFCKLEGDHEPRGAALKKLLAIINNYTGDAISDILVVETILKHFDWYIEQWYNLYQDGSQLDDKLSYLGRNRRVRQKNRYFLDFHCIDLTKGARSNRDDFDAFATNTNTRSSNRRSTTDSIRGQQDETEVFETRYCRKCSSKTPHDFDGGCQACLYKKIVESSKRQKPSGQRNRSATTKQQQQQHDNELETATSSATPALASNKRKSNKQGGSKNKYVNQRYRSIVDLRRNCNINNNDNNNGNNDNNIVNPAPQPQAAPASGDTTIVSATNTTIIEGCSSSTSSNSTSSSTNINTNNHNNINNNINNSKLPKLDSWTPDEVADYILSKGFANEAELFKTQSVDGISLLLMQRTDFTYGLKIKLGPALKIYDQVCKLKREYFKTVTVSQQ